MKVSNPDCVFHSTIKLKPFLEFKDGLAKLSFPLSTSDYFKSLNDSYFESMKKAVTTVTLGNGMTLYHDSSTNSWTNKITEEVINYEDTPIQSTS